MAKEDKPEISSLNKEALSLDANGMTAEELDERALEQVAGGGCDPFDCAGPFTCEGGFSCGGGFSADAEI